MSVLNFSSKSNRISGIGSALVDILLRENDDFLHKTKAPKGGMTLVEHKQIEDILSKTSEPSIKVPGGSACNTIIGIGKLGGPAKFIGKRGDDELGLFFENDLKVNNVEPNLLTSQSPTGRVLSIITPDAQRTMFTYLGASSESTPQDITVENFKDTALVHIEGYLLFNRDLIVKALESAKEAGAKISLDLASFTVVEASKDILDDLTKEYVDIILANEDEAKAFTEIENEEESLKVLAKKASVAVLKQGKRGSIISANGQTYKVGIQGSGDAIDTTGAGDLWASGFLYGLVNGYDIQKSAEIGAYCGYEVCQVIGASIPEEGWNRIKKIL